MLAPEDGQLEAARPKAELAREGRYPSGSYLPMLSRGFTAFERGAARLPPMRSLSVASGASISIAAGKSSLFLYHRKAPASHANGPRRSSRHPAALTVVRHVAAPRGTAAALGRYLPSAFPKSERLLLRNCGRYR